MKHRNDKGRSERDIQDKVKRRSDKPLFIMYCDYLLLLLYCYIFRNARTRSQLLL